MIGLEIAGFGKCDNKECFANVDRRCRILHTADFHGKDCPFFKSKLSFVNDSKAHSNKGNGAKNGNESN